MIALEDIMNIYIEKRKKEDETKHKNTLFILDVIEKNAYIEYRINFKNLGKHYDFCNERFRLELQDFFRDMNKISESEEMEINIIICFNQENKNLLEDWTRNKRNIYIYYTDDPILTEKYYNCIFIVNNERYYQKCK